MGHVLVGPAAVRRRQGGGDPLPLAVVPGLTARLGIAGEVPSGGVGLHRGVTEHVHRHAPHHVDAQQSERLRGLPGEPRVVVPPDRREQAKPPHVRTPAAGGLAGPGEVAGRHLRAGLELGLPLPQRVHQQKRDGVRFARLLDVDHHRLVGGAISKLDPQAYACGRVARHGELHRRPFGDSPDPVEPAVEFPCRGVDPLAPPAAHVDDLRGQIPLVRAVVAMAAGREPVGFGDRFEDAGPHVNVARGGGRGGQPGERDRSGTERTGSAAEHAVPFHVQPRLADDRPQSNAARREGGPAQPPRPRTAPAPAYRPLTSR